MAPISHKGPAAWSATQEAKGHNAVGDGAGVWTEVWRTLSLYLQDELYLQEQRAHQMGKPSNPTILRRKQPLACMVPQAPVLLRGEVPE